MTENCHLRCTQAWKLGQWCRGADSKRSDLAFPFRSHSWCWRSVHFCCAASPMTSSRLNFVPKPVISTGQPGNTDLTVKTAVKRPKLPFVIKFKVLRSAYFELFGVKWALLNPQNNCQHTNTHSVLTAIFPGEPGLAGCHLNSPYPFIPGLCILLGQT